MGIFDPSWQDCPACGAKKRVDYPVCPHCGRDFSQLPPITPKMREDLKDGLAACILILILAAWPIGGHVCLWPALVFGVAVWWFFSG